MASSNLSLVCFKYAHRRKPAAALRIRHRFLRWQCMRIPGPHWSLFNKSPFCFANDAYSEWRLDFLRILAVLQDQLSGSDFRPNAANVTVAQ